MGNMTKRTDGAYELLAADKVYLIRFSVGVKELIFQKVVEVYAKFLENNADEVDPMTARSRNQLVGFYTEYMQEEDPVRREAIKKQIEQLMQDAFTGAPSTEDRIQAKLEQKMSELLNSLHFEVCSLLLTQRDMEGRVTEYVSPNRIKFSGEFDACQAELDELRTKAFDYLNEVVKKSQKISQELTGLLGDKLIPSRMLSQLLRDSTQP